MSRLIVSTAVPHKKIELDSLIAPFTPITDAEAATVANDVFGISGKVTRFATEKDDTFRLEDTRGRRYVLKVANPAEDESELEFQVSLLEHIAATDPILPVPRVKRTADGGPFGRVVDSSGQHRKVRLMSYLGGTPLDAMQSTDEQRECVGATLAKLRLAMSSFGHPAAHRIVPWDVKNLPGLVHLAVDIADCRHADLLAAGIERIASLALDSARLRKQVLHNDFSKSNIVVDPGSPAFITGVIDFGDAVHTAIAIDVSTALLNQLPRNNGRLPSDDMFAQGRDVLRGYLRHADLTADELALIPYFVMARVITRALLSLGLAKRFPNNAAYLLRNTEQGWAQLEWFLHRSSDEIAGSLDLTQSSTTRNSFCAASPSRIL